MIVFKTKVVSRNFISDFGADLKNVIGGNLRTYEKLIDKTTKEALAELNVDYPKVKNVKIQITEFANKSIAILVYGETK